VFGRAAREHAVSIVNVFGEETNQARSEYGDPQGPSGMIGT
jgi:hypothetical protein